MHFPLKILLFHQQSFHFLEMETPRKKTHHGIRYVPTTTTCGAPRVHLRAFAIRMPNFLLLEEKEKKKDGYFVTLIFLVYLD